MGQNSRRRAKICGNSNNGDSANAEKGDNDYYCDWNHMKTQGGKVEKGKPKPFGGEIRLWEGKRSLGKFLWNE